MPYISKYLRNYYKPIVDIIESDSIKDIGVINYLITQLILKGYKPASGELRYEDYDKIIGALECAKLEFYRRKVAPYEDKKIEDNGDVY